MKKLKWLVMALLCLHMLLPTQTSAAGFTDVPTSHWAYQSITKLSNSNIINGYNNGRFGPDDRITRAQAAILIAKALKIPLETSFKPSYQDINPTTGGYKEIVALTEKGIFSNATKFNPSAPLSRDQMAKVLVTAYQIIVDDNHQVKFQDVSTTMTLHSYVTTIAEVGISVGYSPLQFAPKTSVTRAQMAAFLDRAMQFNGNRNKGVIKYDTANKTYIDTTLPLVNEVAKQTARLVNLERAKEGRSTLEIEAPLSKIATIKAEDMNKNDYFDHKSPTYGDPWDMAEHFGYTYSRFGENIAYGQETPEEVVKAWMNSPGHKSNILSHSYTNIGVGIAKDENGRIYWVHMFSTK